MARENIIQKMIQNRITHHRKLEQLHMKLAEDYNRLADEMKKFELDNFEDSEAEKANE